MIPSLFLVACLYFFSEGSAGASVWTAGHGDLQIGYTGGANPSFTALWMVGTGGGSGSVDGMDVYDAPYLTQELTPRAGLFPLPSPDSARTGASLLYLLPQDGMDASFVGAPFQGWAGAGIPAATFSGNRISLSLVGVSGSGAVSLWSDGAFGDPDFKWTSFDGFSAADRMELSTFGHSHYNVGFTHPGEYLLSVNISGDLTAGGSISTPVTLNYVVVPEPGAAACLFAASCFFASVRQRSRQFKSRPSNLGSGAQ